MRVPYEYGRQAFRRPLLVPVDPRRSLSSRAIGAAAAAPFTLYLLLIQTHFRTGNGFITSTYSITETMRERNTRRAVASVQFVPTASSASGTRPARATTCSNSSIGLSNDNDDSEGSNNIKEKIGNFLDTPFFDPDAPIQEGDEGGIMGSFRAWFAGLVKEDYETAEALYAGLFFAVLLFATQELLRMQMYGTDYVPFTHSGGGKLW
mmetsp:Transcript_4495/g.9539  ORF Transcript_4495/g.9539 Transcript_4495/m.9539 type:complete len:207 (-) Transcript_4495:239-859(-)